MPTSGTRMKSALARTQIRVFPSRHGVRARRHPLVQTGATTCARLGNLGGAEQAYAQAAQDSRGSPRRTPAWEAAQQQRGAFDEPKRPTGRPPALAGPARLGA